MLSGDYLAASAHGPQQRHHEILHGEHGVPHNVILGGLWLHMMKVVQFLYYQLLQYPTLTGMVYIRGGQAVSRTISAFAQRRSGWKSKKVKTVSKETSPEKKKLEMVAIEL